MKLKHVYSLAILMVSNVCWYAQVGISTANPQGTLDVTGVGTSTTAKDGVIAPRVTRQQLAAKVAGTYVAAQIGAIVYITDATTPTGTTPSLAQTAEILTTGYYFFNGTLWKNVNSGAQNIYNANGSLTGARVVAQAENTLAFTGSAVNAFSVDGSTFSVDASNDRVGVGTTSPTNKLHVTGTDPIRAEGIQAGNANTDRPMVVDGNGVVKTINTLSVLGIPNPAIFRLETAQTNFLNGVGAGSNQIVPMAVVKNTITGLTYNAATSVMTIPPGNYQMVFVYEGTHDDTNGGTVTPPTTRCTISSYIVDFPIGTGTSTARIHSTAAHGVGGLSNHGGTITYTTQITGTRNWTIQLGRGQSGNCGGVGMNLTAIATHLLVFRIGDL